MKDIAVVIPLYNHEQYIAGGLRSVLGQTRQPRRVIVVDDGSSDGSVAAARAAGGNHVEVIPQDNRGAHEALNRAVSLAADCEFTAILNSDDEFAPERCAVCAEVLENEPAAMLVCTQLQLIDGAGAPLPADHPRSRWFRAAWSCMDTGLPMIEWLARANFPGTTSNFFARTKWFLSHPFRAYRYAHDYFHLLEAAIAGVLRITPGSLVRYRIHDANTITTEPRRLIREMLQVHADFLREQTQNMSGKPDLLPVLAAYRRAVWTNVSALRADAFSLVELRALAQAPSDRISHWLDEAGALPESGEFPNRHLVNAHDGSGSMADAAGLSDRYEALRRDMKALREDMKRLERRLADADRRLASRSHALKRLLGLATAPPGESVPPA